MAAVCSQCGVGSPLGEDFASERHIFEPRRHYCPRCHGQRLERSARRGLRDMLLVPAMAGALVALGHWTSFTPFVLCGWISANLALFWLFLMVTALPHELGHAFVAWAVGFRVF